MQRLSPRFRSQQFFLCKLCGEALPQIYRDLYGDAMLVPIRMGTNMAARNQQETSVTEFCYKSVILSLEELKNNKAILFPIQELFR